MTFTVRRHLDDLQPSTVRLLKRKTLATVDTVLNDIAPGQSKKLLKLIHDPEVDNQPTKDASLKEVIVSLYQDQAWVIGPISDQDSTDRQQKKQLLSMIASTVTKKELQQEIPGLAIHAINEARKHASTHGAGALVLPPKPSFRRKMDLEKLDHALDFFFTQSFHQVSSFGTKEMKLQNGEVVTIPEVVRTACHSTLVTMYQSFCKEIEYTPLCRSTLFYILHVCPSSHRTNLRGLDNIAADGSMAFDTILSTVIDIKRYITDESLLTELQECRDNLCASKIYLKTDYKLHLKQEDTCADHCIHFALSDTDGQMQQACTHQHDMVCDRCDLLPHTFSTIKGMLSTLNIPDDICSEMNVDIKSSEQKIYDWKSHIVRTVNQDRARVDLLHGLKEGEALLIMDWAMKFLPLAYREKQTDWFGQKGISWHVTVCIYKDAENNLKHRTYTQTADGVKQDWMAVSIVLEHVLNTVKSQVPRIEKVFLRSDNAGCYHCGNLWMALPGISDRTGINIVRYDYSEAQSGKSYCDAKIAHMRAKIRTAVASGVDVKSASDMKKAIDMHGGVSACQSAHIQVDLPTSHPGNSSLKGISKLSNVRFNEDGSITTWRAFEIGPGKNVNTIPLVQLPNMEIVSDFVVPNVSEGNIKSPPVQAESEESLTSISCSESGCKKTFSSFSNMQSHCIIGDHEFSLQNLSTYDEVKMKWKDACFNLSSDLIPYRKEAELKEGPTSSVMGWALKRDKKNVRFSEKVRKYLAEMFESGELTGRKANPATVARNMRIARNDITGEKMFQPCDYLEIGQITSYFSRLVVLKKNPVHNDDVNDQDLDAVLLAINKAEAVQELLN